MLRQLNITIGTTPVWQVEAEVDIDPSPPGGIQESISGKLIGLSKEELVKVKYRPNVSVGFDGRPYRFDKLESDGKFKLVKAW